MFGYSGSKLFVGCRLGIRLGLYWPFFHERGDGGLEFAEEGAAVSAVTRAAVRPSRAGPGLRRVVTAGAVWAYFSSP